MSVGVKIIDNIKDIQTVDLQSDSVHDQIKKSLSSLGFLIIKNHGVDLKLIRSAYDVSQDFFNFDQKQKEALSYKNINQKKYSNVGYFSHGLETAVSSDQADPKEFFHVGPSYSNYVNLKKENYADNVWPSFLPCFQTHFEALFEQMRICGDLVFDYLGDIYNFDKSYIPNLSKDGGHVLRSIHYPPIKQTQHAYRAAPHTGIQLLGLQCSPSHKGLEYYTPSQEWIALDSKTFADYLLINIGDMFSYLTADAVPASLHRVSNQDIHKDRYSIVFFYHANHEKPLVSKNSNAYPEIQAGQWLHKRFKELKLY